jgi:hypothetical protein
VENPEQYGIVWEEEKPLVAWTFFATIKATK